MNACREQAEEFGGGHGATVIGGGTANPVYAAFWHKVLVRYVDFRDNFLAPTGTCHTACDFQSFMAQILGRYVASTGCR